MDSRALQNNLSIPSAYVKTNAPSGPVDAQAFEAALGGPTAPAARSTAAPDARQLFQSMSPGLMFNPAASSVAPSTASPVSSARDSLYSRLGVATPNGLQGAERFLSQRGLESEGPVMSFGHAELALVS